MEWQSNLAFMGEAAAVHWVVEATRMRTADGRVLDMSNSPPPNCVALTAAHAQLSTVIQHDQMMPPNQGCISLMRRTFTMVERWMRMKVCGSWPKPAAEPVKSAAHRFGGYSTHHEHTQQAGVK